jgi:hypothetical protein
MPHRPPLVDVVDAGDDDDEIGLVRDHVAIEPRRDLVAALAVDAAIEDAPAGAGLPQPVGVLAARLAGAVRRRLDGRLEQRRARRRRIAERDDHRLAAHCIFAATASAARITRRMFRPAIFLTSSSV